jgi:hypothetical protein
MITILKSINPLPPKKVLKAAFRRRNLGKGGLKLF